MQFLVPQFIDTEDKIFGPISVRQFGVILVGMGFIYTAYKLSTLWLFIIEAVFIFGLVILFAFIKVNGQAFHYFLLNIIQTARRPRLKIWLNQVADEKIYPSKKKTKAIVTSQAKQKVTSSKLTELSLVVDTGGVYKKEKEETGSSLSKLNKKVNG